MSTPTDPRPSTDLLPISLVAHHVFCPRRAWLEAAGERTDTAQMAEGTRAHQPVDDPDGSRRERVHAVDVVSEILGVTGRCDAVEFDDGRITVIEHKATPIRRRTEVTEPTRIQLALLTAALREAGTPVTDAAVYFPNHRQRIPVDIGPTDLDRAQSAVTATATTLTSATPPPPLEDDPRCPRCSHIDVCLPDERQLEPVNRRIIVADPDSQVLHLATQGTRASISRRRVQVRKAGEDLGTIPLERVQAVIAHGNIDLSGALLRELLHRSIPVVWCTTSGRVAGWATSANAPNGHARITQHLASAHGRLDLAAEFVAAKIANQATLLRRHGHATDTVAILRRLQRAAPDAHSLGDLYGIEGQAAAAYFAAFPTMLTDPGPYLAATAGFARSRRPAKDPINAALNYSYGLLLTDVIRAVAACGLDPHAGFLHSSGRNKPALALDLCEEFRAPVADSVVIGAINNGKLKRSHFTDVLGVTNLRDQGRRALIAAYERRVTGRFRHPIFGYDVTWRRAMEIQARLVLGVLDNTQPRYRGITTR